MRTFNLFFKMPQDLELYAAAWAAICAYEQKIRDLGYPLQIVIETPSHWLSKLLIPPMIFTVENISEIEGMSFDMSVDLADDRIKDLGRFGRRAATVCANLIGVTEHISELVKIKPEIPKYDLYFQSWSVSSLKLLDKAIISYPSITFCTDTSNATNAKVVIGYRSIATYLAASAGRSVIELYTEEDYSKDFLPKWSNPRYKMVFFEKKSDIEQHSEFIWKVLEKELENNVLQNKPRAESCANQNT